MGHMKTSKLVAASILSAVCVVIPMSGRGDGTITAGATAKPDLLTTCPVSGDKLGEMGDAYVFVYQGQEVKLCCPNCKKDFDKDPAKYLKKIEAAAEAQK